jgi:hypothetical protein
MSHIQMTVPVGLQLSERLDNVEVPVDIKIDDCCVVIIVAIFPRPWEKTKDNEVFVNVRENSEGVEHHHACPLGL